MEWLSALFSRERKGVTHTVIAVTIALAILVSGPTVSNLIGNSLTTIFYFPFFKLRDAVDRMSQAAADNEALRASVAELSTRLQLYNEILEENRRLRALLGFVPPEEFIIVPAEIIGVYGSGIPNTVMINLGIGDSIKVNETVINQNGVAGRVARVLPEYSVVYLLTEPRCRVAARVKRSREQGIIRYSLERGMYLDNLPRQGDVAVGDTITTSGLGGIFPEGLVIGIVEDVQLPEREFFYDISVRPMVKFNGLDELYVLRRGDDR